MTYASVGALGYRLAVAGFLCFGVIACAHMTLKGSRKIYEK